MKKIIKVLIDLGLGFLLIKINPLDTYSYIIGAMTIFIWIISDKIYEKYFK